MRIPLAVACALLCSTTQAADVPVAFDREIRPILSNHCFQCHGPDEKARKGKLRLDVRDDALERGAIVPGKPEASELLKRVHADDEKLRITFSQGAGRSFYEQIENAYAAGDDEPVIDFSKMPKDWRVPPPAPRR